VGVFMACSKPLHAVRSSDGSITIISRQDFLVRPIVGEHLYLPCGQCVSCRIAKSRDWAIRCVHEASLWPCNCFITLTYDSDHVPIIAKNHTLHKRDFVLFMKRFRESQGPNIRFFQAGEYGECCAVCQESRLKCKCQKFVPDLGRPHHHAAIFNYDFIDKYFFKCKHGVTLYRSPLLEKLWPWGFSSVGDLTYESAAYVARYCLKKINGPRAESHYQERVPEYTTMSRNPGIANDFIREYYQDIYPKDSVHHKGVALRPSRYYDKVYDTIDPSSLDAVKERRKNFASALSQTRVAQSLRHEYQKNSLRHHKRGLEMDLSDA